MAAWLMVSGSVYASLVITTDNQFSTNSVAPTWTVATNNLIGGFSPAASSGDFQLESAGGLPVLTDGVIGPITTGHGLFATAGNGGGAGSLLIYQLPASTNGYNLTNITVYGGWVDSGRDAQAYVLSYATVANPSSFLPLATVSYNPTGPDSTTPSATRVAFFDSSGAPIASNVAAIKFDFTPSVENGYVGYSEITVQGTPATNAPGSGLIIKTDTQSSASSFIPSWTIENDSLIAGQQPSSVGPGNFTFEAGVAGVTALTDATFGTVDSKASYATCGLNAGQSVSYYLNNATLTNIVVYSGWPDVGRDGQFYTIYYSTVLNPASFIPLAGVSYNPAVTGITANRVAISSTAGVLASNIAYVKFDFTPQNGNLDNGYSGYAEIILEGTNAPTPALPPAPITTLLPTSASGGADAVLTFNEIMYHPVTNEAGMEWFELYNQMAVDVDISKWHITGDTDYTFPNGTRVAGRSYIVVARDPAQLMAATGLSSNVFGPFNSPLNNAGGTLALFNNSGRLMDSIRFGTDGSWPVTPDGAGPSLAKIDRDWASSPAANWRASSQNGGTPCVENFPAPGLPVTIAFNEFSGTTNSVFWLELMNYGTNPVSLGNCILHHDGSTNTDYVFSPGASVNAGSFLVLSNSTLGFVSPASGDKLFLFATNRTAVYDGVVLKKSPRARSPDGTGTLLVPNLTTPGSSNSFAVHTELVINEIMYNHAAFPSASTNILLQSNPEEWVELYNRGSNSVDLTGWSLSGGISFTFSAGKTISPGGYLVVARASATFRATHSNIDIVGDYSGHLGSDDEIILNDPLGNPANRVHYFDGGRWPESAGGGGSSLELRDPKADNSRAEAWAPSEESQKSSWQTFTYRMVAQPSATPAMDNQWHEFALGLLTDGECWVDDISVIQSPTNNPIQLISNGNFETGLTGWRLLGNHQRSGLETDPDNPANHVLHVIASGPQEHMNNHIETTLAAGRSVANGQLYEISFRARWITGNNLLNTRLYFNRGARTTMLAVPQLNGTPGAVNSRYATNIGPTFSLFQHQPVVPLAYQPETVFAAPQDPQGVSACAVWWSANGGAWSNSVMTQTNGYYSGTIPGLAAGTLVQFYVSAADGLGAAASFPARGSNSGAFYRVNDGLANVPLAHTFRILMSPANIALQNATTNLMSNENLPCTVIYDERLAFYDLAVRLKSSERGRVDSTRIGFHLQFNPDELFRGVHPVMLLDRSGGGARPQQEEIVLKHMALHAGIPTVNSDLCEVIAPQSAQNGLAILSPRYEDNFIGSAFTNGSDGTLFEYELTYYPTTANGAGYKLPSPDDVQGVDISDLGTDKEPYRYNFIIKNHRSTDDYFTLINFARAFSLNGTLLDSQTRSVMDLDEWLSVYALVSLCGVGDMYTFGGDHNMMTYVRPSDGRVVYLPWDMDFSFSQASTAPLVGDQNLSRIINLPGNLRRFYAHVLDLISTTYNTGYMTYWVNHYDSFPGQDWSGDLTYISQRANFAISTINGAGGNAPFVVSGANPITVSSNLVTLSGTAPVQVTSILINGISYPVTWSSITNWTLQVPVTMATNVLNVQAYGLDGNLIASATVTALFTGSATDPARSIVFNEIMYNPAVSNAAYVELLNTSTNAAFDLSGWHVNGLSYTFPSGSILLPNGILVLAEDRVAFGFAYGNTLPLFDRFSGNLDPTGETLTLFRPDPAQTNQELVVDRVRYEAGSPWPVSAAGAALQLIDASQDNSRVANWAEVQSNTVPTPKWVRAAATGIPQPSAGLRPLYIYLQSPGNIYVDDVSVVAGSVAESGVNLVTNGSFETSLSPWTIGSDGNNSASVSSTNVAHSGSRSLHLIASAGGTTQNSSIWQDFSGRLTVGGTYTLSFWYLQSTNGGPLTVRFSGSGISITTNPAPAAVAALSSATPDAANSVAASLPAFPSVWLNELQASNVTGPTNNVGNRVPWVELYNPGSNTLSLSGFYLSDNYTNLTQWAFPANISISASNFLVIWCDGQTNQGTVNSPHGGFTLASGNGAVALSRLVSGQPQIVDYLAYSSLPSNWSYGDLPDGQPFYRQQMFVATPASTNSGASVPITISINEWMADNAHTLVNPVGGNFDDWFELYNYGTNVVDLGGYYLTGTLTNKTKFQIPNTHQYLVPPHGFFLVWADNSSSANNTNRPDLHVNFKLSKSGDSIGMFAADGTAIDPLTFGAQATDVSQGRFPDGAINLYSMPTPTPQTNNIIPNTPPSLAFISNKFVYAGQTVQFTAAAMDAESFYQTLTFSLSNAPAGASIDPVSGAFLWVTMNATAPGTNSILVRVTDNGVPPLSDSRAFSVIVSDRPRFSGVSAVNGGQIKLSIDTLSGQHYQVQFKNQLNDSIWTSLGGNIPGNGSTVIVYDDLTAPAQKFYRVVAFQ